MKKLIKVHPDDNVAVVLTDLFAGDTVDFEGKKVTFENTTVINTEDGAILTLDGTVTWE